MMSATALDAWACLSARQRGGREKKAGEKKRTRTSAQRDVKDEFLRLEELGHVAAGRRPVRDRDMIHKYYHLYVHSYRRKMV